MNSSPTSVRIELLDVIRGIAIFGMFTVNMTADVRWSDQYDYAGLAAHDFATMLAINLLTNGKFITIFSFLFGIGFFIQAQRRMTTDSSVPSFWLRRMSGLLIIGLAATACTLPARILLDYAVFGLGLLLFYRLPARWILAAALGTFVFTESFALLAPEPGSPAPGPAIDIHDELDAALPAGSFLQLSALELRHAWIEFTSWRYYAGDLDILGLMLIGLYVGRIGAVDSTDMRTALARKWVGWLLGVGTIGCAAWVAMSMFGLPRAASEGEPYLYGLLPWPLGMPIMGLGYAAAIALLMNHDKWRRRLLVFAPIGQMALTNYLFTGLVAAFLSFQWGLGLYGAVYPAAGLAIVVALLPAQALASRWWLRRFAFGPCEWLWRRWTYGRLRPLRTEGVMES